MKPIIVYLLFTISATLLYSQSSIVYDSNTSLYLGSGADICAATITMNGTFSGGGTFCNQPVGVETEDNSEVPEEFSLSQNYPNPFNPVTAIKYSLAERSHVTINIYDVLGKEIETLVNEEKQTGTYEITWNASALPSGVYFYQIKAGSFVETKNMVLLR